MSKSQRSVRSVQKRTPWQNIAAFAEFLTQEMEHQELSSYKIEEKAKAAGLTIDHSTVWRAASGKNPEVSSSTIAVLSEVLNIPIAKMRQVLEGEIQVGGKPASISVTVSSEIQQKLMKDARQHHRSIDDEVAAILSAYYGEDVNLNKSQIKKTQTLLRQVK